MSEVAMHCHTHTHTYHHKRAEGATYSHSHPHPVGPHDHKHDHGGRHERAHLAHQQEKQHTFAREHDHTQDILDFDRRAQTSPIRHVHAGIKLLFAITTLFLCIGFDNLWVSLYVCGSMLAILHIVCKVSVHELFDFMKIPLTFLMLSVAAIAVQFTGKPVANAVLSVPLFSLYISITQASLTQAGLLFCKAYGAVCCLYFISVSTTIQSLIYVMKVCKCPSILVELTYLIYRYLFVLLNILRKMLLAANARLGYVSLRSSWYSFVHIGGNLLIQSFKRSSACYDAMEARCYDGVLAFYTPRMIVKPKHALLATAYVLSVVAVGLLMTLIIGG